MRGVIAPCADSRALVLPGTKPARGTTQVSRPEVRGKFLGLGNSKFYVRGVTYGTFPTDASGRELWQREMVERDFHAMAANGFNAVRVYTVPPCWMLDLAQQCGLQIMVGLPWEQHVNFLDDRSRRNAIEERVRASVRACGAHPAILCFAVGNEIPSNVVRWHGPRALGQYVDCLARAVKEEDPGALVTYVNYPSTEYLRLAAIDFVSFNVYLERQATFESYLARLHNLAEGRPLLMTEMGLDSRRHGSERQALILDWQVRTAMASGCAGAFVFAWTDEWHRGGHSIEDWDFGLTTRTRHPKPALSSVREAFAEAPFPNQASWPRVTVVVCTHNGGRTLFQCLRGLQYLDYPNFEVIVVDDGSTDNSAEIAGKFDVRLIRTPNLGLSSARNTGWEEATGELVAYIDDDAYPDPHWLRYLARSFQKSSHSAIGGPNVPPPGDGLTAECIANSPGGPTHVLLSDDIAEHIPGCNMAFRRDCLRSLGGFDPQFRVAGDDVDICWRVQERGWTIGFSPAALVWHHRRGSLKAYWKQQIGYGKAEALLEKKWPEKYNAAGHVTWSGRVYGKGVSELFGCSRIYHGIWGSAPFQSVYQRAPMAFLAIPSMPEWWLLIGALASLTALGLFWRPLFWFGSFLALAFGLLVVQALLHAQKVSTSPGNERPSRRWLRFGLTAGCHLLQPLARLVGRLRYGLTAWRHRGPRKLLVPCRQRFALWSEQWRGPEDWLTRVERLLRNSRSVVLKGGPFDDWDLEVRGGLLGAARILMLVEEHGDGKQFVRFKTWPNFRITALFPFFLFAFLAVMASFDHAFPTALVLGAVSGVVLFRMSRECAWAQAALKSAFARLDEQTKGTLKPR
jgi:GT2 family glycosyltransferase